jgi:nitrogen regulatory protein P-II 1
MKEIKAYIRRDKAEYVISALEEAGVPGCTAVEVKAVGAAAVPEEEYLSIEYIDKVSTVTKLEIICKDEDESRLVDVIKKTAYSGRRGDGMIFVSDINYAVKIRTGETGDAVLVPAPDRKRKKKA